MSRLIFYEMKKLWKNKLYVGLLLALIILPTCLTIYQETTTIGMTKYKQAIARNQKYASMITEDWWKERINEYNKLNLEYRNQVIDSSKMVEVYGPNWKQDPELYACIYEYNKKDCKLYLLENAPIVDQELEPLHNVIAYGEYILNQGWEHFDKREYHVVGIDDKGEMILEYDAMTKAVAQETELVRKSFRKQTSFYYGDTMILKSILDSLQLIGILLAFYMLMLFASIWNKENKYLDILKTTKQGKRKLIKSKLWTTVLLGIIISIFVVFVVIFIHILVFGFPDLKSPLQILTMTFLHRITVWNSLETLLFVTDLFILGSISISLFSFFLSRILKSSYHSLIIGFLILVVSLFVFDFKLGTFSLKSLIPIEYMHFSYHLLVETSTIGNYSFYNVLLVLKSSLLSFCWIPIILYFDQRKEV